MITPGPWFERPFTFDASVDLFPLVVERLRGTPVRLEEKLIPLNPDLLRQQVDDRWSIQENAGHLLDLEPLWYGRVEDVLNQEKWLRPADLENTATFEAGYNAWATEELLHAFRKARQQLVARLDALTAGEAARSALHPRLHQPMRILDLAIFVAEHDDHHLARIQVLAQVQDPS